MTSRPDHNAHLPPRSRSDPVLHPLTAYHGEDDADVQTTEISLRSDQSFKAWAQAHSAPSKHPRGMDAGQFLRAMVVNDKSEAERRALSEASDAAGGYTVPNVLSAELIDRARAQSVVMRAARARFPSQATAIQSPRF